MAEKLKSKRDERMKPRESDEQVRGQAEGDYDEFDDATEDQDISDDDEEEEDTV